MVYEALCVGFFIGVTVSAAVVLIVGIRACVPEVTTGRPGGRPLRIKGRTARGLE